MNANIQKFPLDPELVGAMVTLPALDSTPFSASGSWNHGYRCDVFGGYTKGPEARRNGTVGTVALSRRPALDGTVALRVRETTHYKGRWRRERQANLTLCGEGSEKLVAWKNTIAAYADSKRPRHLLDLEETSDLTGAQRKLVTNGHASALAGARDLVADVQLFDSVQRVPRRLGTRWTFDYLEQLRTVRRGHVLCYRGLEARRWAGQSCSLHHFVQLGAGVAPIDYWLSEAGRLVLVTTTTIAWILDSEPVTHWTPLTD